MSKARRIRRQQERFVAKHLDMLGELLGEFYTFLEKHPKPTEEEVRDKFIKSENTWKAYCSKNQLTERASLLFNQEVAQSWESRYSEQKNMMIQN